MSRRGWIGIDVSPEHDPRRFDAVLPLLILALVVGLGIASLRIDLIRTRYAVAAAMDEESTLLEAQRALIVDKRRLRDPVILANQARDRGFRPPAHVFALPDPIPGHPILRPVQGPGEAPVGPALPQIAARPSLAGGNAVGAP